jgi:hypothetical protein
LKFEKRDWGQKSSLSKNTSQKFKYMMANSVYEAFFISSECRVVRHLTHLPRLRVALDFYKLKLKVKVHVRGGTFTLIRFNRGAHKAGTRVVQVKVTLNSSFMFVTLIKSLGKSTNLVDHRRSHSSQTCGATHLHLPPSMRAMNGRGGSSDGDSMTGHA